MSTSWQHIGLGEAIAFEGVRDRAVVSGCEKALNTIYWSLFCFAVPIAVFEHLIVNYDPIGWLHVAVPALYVPVALRWIPLSVTTRFLIGLVALTIVGLSVNSLYGWEPQPGIYLMVIPALIIYCLCGGEAMLKVTVVQMMPVVATTLALNPNSPLTGALIACATWFAVNLAGALLVHRMLAAVLLRNKELEHLSDKLLDAQETLVQNEDSVTQIAHIGIGRASRVAKELANQSAPHIDQAAFERLIHSLDEVYDALVCENRLKCDHEHRCSECPGKHKGCAPPKVSEARATTYLATSIME